MNRKNMQKIKKILDYPFNKLLQKLFKTLFASKLDSKEYEVVQQSMVQKYIPILRDSCILAIIATPGVILSAPEKIQFVLAIIASVTGIAWFTVSLKEVKAKFLDFGVELTGDMLKSFMITVFIITILFLYIVFEDFIPMTTIELASTEIKLLFLMTTAIVGIYIFWNLIKAVLKFDANDAMLTGSADAARRYFEEALSPLRSAANYLKQEHDYLAANYYILMALNHYIGNLDNCPEKYLNLYADRIDLIHKNIESPIEKLDPIINSLLIDFLKTYKPHIHKSDKVHDKYQFQLESLQHSVNTQKQGRKITQPVSDLLIATTLELLAELHEVYAEKLCIEEN